MVNNLNVARPYAKAIFELALAQEKLPEFENLLQLLSNAVTDTDAADFLKNPERPFTKKVEFLLAICDVESLELQEKIKNFVTLLVQKNKLFILPQIVILYKKLRGEYENVMPAKVVSAFALEAQQLEKIKLKLEQKFKSKVVLDSIIDTDLIGGIVIYAKDFVVDGSIKGQLQKMMEYLK